MTKKIKQSEPSEITEIKNICEVMADEKTKTASTKVTKEAIQSFGNEINKSKKEPLAKKNKPKKP